MNRPARDRALVLLALAGIVSVVLLGPPLSEAALQSGNQGALETVQVPAPTGETETDRAGILAALDRVRPGGKIEFAPGTYLVGELLRVSVPGITLRGHPEGTTIQGCEREDEAERLERFACNGFELVGGNQTVRDFTFERAHFALVLGCCVRGPATGETPPPDPPGGYRVEHNVFRNSRTGIRVLAGASETTVIRDNVFRNTGHAVGINSGTVHVLDNDVSAPEPGRIPGSSHTLGAIGVTPTTPECGENVIAGNRIAGHPDGISVDTILPGVRCQRNVIRDNTIIAQRVPIGDSPLSGLRMNDESDRTLVGVPLIVADLSESADLTQLPPSFLSRFEGEAVVGDHLIEDNRILGAEGIGIEVRGSSGNRIVGNTVSGIRARDPFPGNLANSPDPAVWREANGSVIWISPGSDGNQVLGNTFEDVASAAVFVEGDRNLVMTRGADEEVHDLGTGNRVHDTDVGADRAGGAVPSTTQSTATIRVAAPTGQTETDRSSILAALEEVRPGGTVRFAPGTYTVGDFIEVPVPEITLVGHPEGTTLRGCEPAELVEPRVPCNGLHLTGRQQTVRDLTIEHTSHALWVGCCLSAAESGYGAEGPHVGGHLIEGNTIRATWNGVRVIGDSPDPVVIRDNDFVDTWHAAMVNGRTAHIVDNRISVPEPGRVPINDHPGLAMSITPFDTELENSFTCAGNVISGNRIEGHPEGIAIQAFRADAACRDNVVRGNTIVVSRVRFTPPSWGVIGDRNDADPTLAGVPLALADLSAEMASQFPQLPDDTGDEELVHDNLIVGNRIVGAEGVAIEFLRASRNLVVNNTITGVTLRDPFPGNTLMFEPGWREANGSGIWISRGSDDNQILGNTFDDVASAAVFVEGDRNLVVTSGAEDRVRDLGDGNALTRRGGDAVGAGREPSSATQDGEAQGTSQVVRVASPTGEGETDRAGILAALEQVRPGGTLQFAAGTYLIGEIIRVPVPGITLRGHPDGTTLRGCAPDDFPAAPDRRSHCQGLELAAGHQTVRDLTFEHTWHGVLIGCCEPENAGDQPGGHLVEGNRFRQVATAIRVLGPSAEPSVIRDNAFRNVFHAVQVNGGTAHVVDNDITVPEPERVPPRGRPGNAIGVYPTPVAPECGENVVAGNRIEGHADAIALFNRRPRTRCRRNVIRDNTLVVHRVPIGEDRTGIRGNSDSDPTVVGVPLAVTDLFVPGQDPEVPGGDPSLPVPPGSEGKVAFGDHLIEGNRILGAEGVGIEIRRSSGNRIVDNVVTGIEARDPFPGNVTHSADPEAWREANGSGIWISPGSDGNQVLGNTFEDVATAAVWVEGDGNTVVTTDRGDVVRDPGGGRRVSSRSGNEPTGRFLTITPVTVIDVRQGVALPDMTVIVTGDRITTVGASDSVDVPRGSTIVDGTGKYLIPGLWDMHAHLDAPEFWHRRESTEAQEAMLSLLLANGVTGIRDMGSGLDPVLRLKQRVESGDLLGPRLVVSGPILDDDPSVWPGSLPVDHPEEARAAVSMLVREDVDFIKTYGKLQREEYFAIADEARRLGIWYVGHLPNMVSIEEAIEAGQRSFEHLQGFAWRCTDRVDELAPELRNVRGPDSPGLQVHFGTDPRVLDGFDPVHCRPLLRLLARSRTWHVPTMIVFETELESALGSLQDSHHRYVPEVMQEHWEERQPDATEIPVLRRSVGVRRELVAAMNRAGVRILAGTDMPASPGNVPGFSLHRELALLVEAGLTPAEALRAATLEPARYLARDFEMGTVEFGRVADLVLLDANPLDDIQSTRRVHGVVSRGRWLGPQALDRLLAAAAHAASH